MTHDGPWLGLLVDIERVVLSDDEDGAYFQRRRADALLERCKAQPDLAESCPDRSLFEMLIALLTLWAARAEVERRARVAKPLLCLIDCLATMPSEARRRAEAEARLSPIERAIPPSQR